MFNIPLDQNDRNLTCTQLKTALTTLNTVFTNGELVYYLSQHKYTGWKMDKRELWLKNWKKLCHRDAVRQRSDIEAWMPRKPGNSIVLAWMILAPVKKFSALSKKIICKMIDLPEDRVVFGFDEDNTYLKMKMVGKKYREHVRITRNDIN